MKKLFSLITVLLLFASLLANHGAYAGFETDLNAFQVGDSEGKVATFKFLGEEKTMGVSELKEMLKALDYGRYFAGDEPNSGYTAGVDRAFKEYIELYTNKLKTAEIELNKSQSKI